MPAVEAISEPALIWLAPPKMMPFWLITSTWPGALMLPRIWLGPRLPITRFSAVQLLACWLKLTVVWAPTLKRLPVQDRLRRGLVDRHIGLAAAGRLGRQIGTLPNG